MSVSPCRPVVGETLPSTARSAACPPAPPPPPPVAPAGGGGGGGELGGFSPPTVGGGASVYGPVKIHSAPRVLSPIPPTATVEASALAATLTPKRVEKRSASSTA